MDLDIEELKRLTQRDKDELEMCKQFFPKAEWQGFVRHYEGEFVVQEPRRKRTGID